VFGKLKRILPLIAGVLLPINCFSGWFGASFSADAVQTDLQNRISKGKMYVGKGKVRTELYNNGMSMVEIIDPERKVALLLLPDKKIYMERTLPDLDMVSADKNEGNPCASLPDATCKKVAQKVLNGRNCDQWEISLNGKKALQWNDSQHKFPVRQEIDGVVTLELSYKGNELVDGRDTEKWQSVMTGNDGRPIHSFQWYDSVLNTAIRHQMPGGNIRELKNIRIGEQPESLFVVPEGFRKESISTIK
jgi:hypothetical protein